MYLTYELMVVWVDKANDFSWLPAVQVAAARYSTAQHMAAPRRTPICTGVAAPGAPTWAPRGTRAAAPTRRQGLLRRALAPPRPTPQARLSHNACCWPTVVVAGLPFFS